MKFDKSKTELGAIGSAGFGMGLKWKPIDEAWMTSLSIVEAGMCFKTSANG